ncbi:MAG: HDOD domain-containing protein [Planctomycetota bacterium]
MNASTTEQHEVVEKALREISHIATLPEVTLRIVELVEDPTSTAQDLHNVISNDPALCSRILKVVNSSFYGLPGQIGSINRAIVLLGLNAVKNIAISASLAKLFRGGQVSDNFSARDLWTHSVATAAAAKLVADELGLALTDEAFLAGLIHDIGIMVEMQANRQQLAEVVDQIKIENGVPSADMLELERQIMGADHQAFGKGLCEKWKFPASFASVCGYHHNPLDLQTGERTLTMIIHVADKLAARVADEGFALDVKNLEVDSAVLEELGLTREKFDAVAERLPDELEEVEVMLS